MSGEESHTARRRVRGQHVVSALRLAAFVLVIVGFAGWLEAGAVDPESAYTIAFGLGVLCAVASIYLHIARESHPSREGRVFRRSVGTEERAGWE